MKKSGIKVVQEKSIHVHSLNRHVNISEMTIIITLTRAIKDLVFLNLSFFKWSNLELIVNHQALVFEFFWSKFISYA
jgi:hypothetical protein